MSKADVKEGTVTLSHGATRYLESGQGSPVILLHGVAIAGGADDWRPALEELGSGYRFIAPDIIGFPPGDIVENIDAFPYMTDFVREFQDALGLKSSSVVGATMGGWIAGLFGYESPNRVDKLVMTGNPGFHGAANNRLNEFKAPEEEAVRAAIQKVAPMLGDEEREALVKEKLNKIQDPAYADAHATMMKTMGDPAKRQRFNLRRRLPSITSPSLFLLGRGDPTSEVADEIQALLPGSRYHIVEDGAHQVHYENAPEFAEVVLQFLGS